VGIVDTPRNYVCVYKCVSFYVCCSVLQCVAVCMEEFVDTPRSQVCAYKCVGIVWIRKCVAVCCSVLQCVAVCGSVLQCVAVCGSVWQCVAVCCSVWQCVNLSKPPEIKFVYK